jgi:hypothetical protein
MVCFGWRAGAADATGASKVAAGVAEHSHLKTTSGRLYRTMGAMANHFRQTRRLALRWNKEKCPAKNLELFRHQNHCLELGMMLWTWSCSGSRHAY